MIIWIDAQISPSIAVWISEHFQVEAKSLRYLGLIEALDPDIFMKARENKAILMSKDSDFQDLLDQYGPPPQIIWVTCGNTSNTRLREILKKSLKQAILLLKKGEPLVEITDESVPFLD